MMAIKKKLMPMLSVILATTLALAALASCAPAASVAVTQQQEAGATTQPQQEMATTAQQAAGTAGQAETPESITTIEFWHSFGSGANEETMNKFISDFNAMRLGYEVNGTFQGNYAEILGKLTVAYAANEVPALSIVDSVDCPQLNNMGMLVNLTEFVSTYEPSYDFGVFFDGLMNYGTSPEGYIYAIPYGRSTPLMYINMDIVKEATGEAIIPATREEFVSVLEAVRDNTDKNPFSCPLVCWYFANFLTSSGHGFMSKDGLSSYFAIDEGALKTFTFWDWLSNEELYIAPPVGNNAWINVVIL